MESTIAQTGAEEECARHPRHQGNQKRMPEAHTASRRLHLACRERMRASAQRARGTGGGGGTHLRVVNGFSFACSSNLPRRHQRHAGAPEGGVDYKKNTLIFRSVLNLDFQPSSKHVVGECMRENVNVDLTLVVNL